MKCYNCHQFGHLAYRCPNKETSSQSKKMVNYVQEDTSTIKSPEINLDSESGDNLIIRRFLIKELVREEPKQRRSFFKVKCKILGKVYKVIIDIGTDNIISEEAMNKLGVPRIPHDHPYRVTWLNKGKHVLVNE